MTETTTEDAGARPATHAGQMVVDLSEVPSLTLKAVLAVEREARNALRAKLRAGVEALDPVALGWASNALAAVLDLIGEDES